MLSVIMLNVIMLSFVAAQSILFCSNLSLGFLP
jgi:hypothetical protein